MAYFEQVSKINFEGKQSDNPFAFKFYNPQEIVAGKTMEEHLRFSMAYWHTLVAGGSDPFGVETAERPWSKFTGLDLAKARVEAAFELLDKLNLPYFAFHDVDIAPEGASLKEFYSNLDTIVDLIEEHMKATGKNCCGIRRTCLAIHVICMELRRLAMQMYTHTQLLRLKKGWKWANVWARITMFSGEAVKATKHC